MTFEASSPWDVEGNHNLSERRLQEKNGGLCLSQRRDTVVRARVGGLATLMDMVWRPLAGPTMDDLRETIRRIWGYRSLLPLQQEAMTAVLDGRDSIVVLPTGGGKSLCYQAPAAAQEKLAVVVSPLISLMKDQVDGLVQVGVAAACLNSAMTPGERARVEAALAAGRVRLLYAAPERVVLPGFLTLLQRVGVQFFAVDEAHCISQWGHDFRPEYRQLRLLRETFPTVAVHAYTATATREVRADIAAELRLARPEILIGSFDRPNLTYRIQSRAERLRQLLAAVGRHQGEAGIIYCIRRAEVDELAEVLRRRGYRAAPYHAGLSDEARRQNQEAFANERVDIVVATVAFGMGIDRSNVRYVIHAGMPRSIEHYQQEAGRAGRDGLPAECLLLYSGADYAVWRSILTADGAEAPPWALKKLGEMYGLCQSGQCRHRTLVRYFGQEYRPGPCGACDVCLGEVETISDSLVVAQKVLSCVVRVGERFGADHVADVLRGAGTDRILSAKHNRLSTYGLLKEYPKTVLREWIEQLLGQGFLARAEGAYPTLRVTDSGRGLLRGQGAVSLTRPLIRPSRKTTPAPVAPGEDPGLFEVLRTLRREIAQERGVPPYLIFNDATLREMARLRPVTDEALLRVKGVGERKQLDFGPRFLQLLRAYRAPGA